MILILMIAAGCAIALSVMIGIAAIEQGGGPVPAAAAAPDRNRIAASILFQSQAGGSRRDEALSDLRKVGIISPLTDAIDICSWSEHYARVASADQRHWLLETAVKLVAMPGRPVPVRQYAQLLDISCSLGFQTDALAKLREQYRFDYVDHAKDARPREADRGGGAMPLFVRGSPTPPHLKTSASKARRTATSSSRRIDDWRRSIIPTRSTPRPEAVRRGGALHRDHRLEALMAITD
jgi:hypothetical protein